MLKWLRTLARGAVAKADSAALDTNAVPILDPQLLDVLHALGQPHRELPCATAHQAWPEPAGVVVPERIKGTRRRA